MRVQSLLWKRLILKVWSATSAEGDTSHVLNNCCLKITEDMNNKVFKMRHVSFIASHLSRLK